MIKIPTLFKRTFDDGKEVFHTGFRNIVDPTIEEMEQAVEDYFKFTELLQKPNKRESTPAKRLRCFFIIVWSRY